MPVYVYRCESCGSEFEKRQSFSDAPLTECESCHGRLQKVLQPAVVIYKGSGFYSTDNRSSSNGHGGNGSSGKGAPAKTSDDNSPAESKDSSKSATAAAGEG